jgi:hypothetical protein
MLVTPTTAMKPTTQSKATARTDANLDLPLPLPDRLPGFGRGLAG